MICIIDYKAGNAPSVLNAFQKLGFDAKLVSNITELRKASKIVLPGVGSARATMESLAELGIISELENLVTKKYVPFMGICVGLQVLFEHSEEGNVNCLGWLKGKIKRFDSNLVRVPQMGWNETNFVKDSKFTKGLSNKDYFYFVNSYYLEPDDESIVLGKTDYGKYFASMIEENNIVATQFHAEKSGDAGLTILKNFAEIGGAENAY